MYSEFKLLIELQNKGMRGDVFIYTDHPVRNPRLVDYSDFIKNQMAPGEEFAGPDGLESMLVTGKFYSPATLWAHQRGDKATVLTTAFLDPHFSRTDHFGALANFTDSYPEAKWPYAPHLKYPGIAMDFMYFIS